jgi:hypothetical protein
MSHLKRLLYLMISEDRERPLQATVGHGDTQLVRRLPVIAHAHMNPVSTQLKQLQETTAQNMSLPKGNPLYDQLHKAYMGKILYDGGCYRVISIQFVPNKGKNVYPCWEATTEPVYSPSKPPQVPSPGGVMALPREHRVFLNTLKCLRGSLGWVAVLAD